MRLPKLLLQRKADSNKGNYGHVFVLAGSLGMTGAACLCAQAAMRSGAGLVTLGIPESLNSIVASKLNEVMTLPLWETDRGSLDLKAFEDIRKFSEKIDVLAIGPGLSVNKSTQALIRKICTTINKPIVLDADGINAFDGFVPLLKKVSKKGPCVLTPHPGELSRLFKLSVAQIQKEREKIAKNFSDSYNMTIVLKGHKTIVASENNLYVNSTGNPGMASGGCGDVLTGIISSFLAQGLGVFEAAKFGVYLHGLAGDFAKKDKTEFGLVASDIIENIPYTFKEFGVK